MIMTLDAFTQKFPKLYRIGEIGARPGIRKHGLLSAKDAAERAGVDLPKVPRSEPFNLYLPDGTKVVVTDNKPLSFKKLTGCLLDGLSAHEWLEMLNSRVFFWPEEKFGKNNFEARRKLGYKSEWQVYDSRKLLEPVWGRTEIAPINTGATLHTPALRGLSTFEKLQGLNFESWRRRRGLSSLDVVKEVTVLGSIPNAGRALFE